MLLHKRSRYFVKHDLGLRTPRGSGPALPLIARGDALDALSVFAAAIANNTAAHAITDTDTVRITALEVREQDDLAIFLVRRRDEEASTQVFEHGGTGALRTPDVDPREAPAVSCHLFVRLTANGAAHPSHRAILEEVPGLGRTYINYILSRVLRPAEYAYRDRFGKPGETYTIPSLDGLPSETLGRALEGGAIRYVELIRPPALDGLDMAGLISHPQRLKLSVKADYAPLDILNRVRDWAAEHDWNKVRVQVETSDERTKVIEISREADAADVLFVRSELVTAPSDIKVCTDTINEELVDLAKVKLAADEGW